MDILFVDDSELVRREVGARLREHPAVGRIVCRASVSDARRALEKASFDLWVLDFQLQDGTALDLLRCRREGLEPSRSGVVVFTNHATPLVRDRCLQAGADHIFDKADGVEEMMAAIEAIGPRPDAS